MNLLHCVRAPKLAALVTLALLAGLGNTNANAQQIKTVFVIAMENHNWTQPANQFTGSIQQIFQTPAAPFINSLGMKFVPAPITGASAENVVVGLLPFPAATKA